MVEPREPVTLLREAPKLKSRTSRANKTEKPRNCGMIFGKLVIFFKRYVRGGKEISEFQRAKPRSISVTTGTR